MKLFIALCSLFFALPTYTQDYKRSTFALTAGWNYSDIRSDAGYTTKGRNGFYGGLLWERQLSQHFQFQSGFLFTQNGYEMQQHPEIDKVSLNYITVPLSAKLVLGPVYAIGGFTAGFRIGGQTTFTNGEHQTLTYDDVKWHDIGTHVGLGLRILNIGIETRYNWGLTDILPGPQSMNNQYFQIGFSFHLP